MTFRDFEQAFRDRPCISVQEMGLRFPDFGTRRLFEWQQKGYVEKVRNRYYRLTERPMTDMERWAIANTAYAPSYVSLEAGLGYYQFIPEGVFHVTSITTSNTKHFTLRDTNYWYRNVKPSFYFGYRAVEFKGVRVLMADPEKVLLDLLHLRPSLKHALDFDAMRFHDDEILERIRPDVWDDYLTLAGSRALAKRAHTLMKWLHDQAR